MPEPPLCIFHLKLKVFDVLIQCPVPPDYAHWVMLISWIRCWGVEGLKIPRKRWEGVGFLLLWELQESCCRFAQSLQWGQSRGSVCPANGTQNYRVLVPDIPAPSRARSNTVEFLLNRRAGSNQEVKNRFSRAQTSALE